MWKRKKNEEIREKRKDLPAPIVTDPNGSYTGRPVDSYDRPIQDADDL